MFVYVFICCDKNVWVQKKKKHKQCMQFSYAISLLVILPEDCENLAFWQIIYFLHDFNAAIFAMCVSMSKRESPDERRLKM